VGQEVGDLGHPGRRQDVGDAGQDPLARLADRGARRDAEPLAQEPRHRVERAGALLDGAGQDPDLGIALAGEARQLDHQPALAEPRRSDQRGEAELPIRQHRRQHRVEGGQRGAPPGEPAAQIVDRRDGLGELVLALAEQVALDLRRGGRHRVSVPGGHRHRRRLWRSCRWWMGRLRFRRLRFHSSSVASRPRAGGPREARGS
jgi:hypothetical protein